MHSTVTASATDVPRAHVHASQLLNHRLRLMQLLAHRTMPPAGGEQLLDRQRGSIAILAAYRCRLVQLLMAS